MGAAATGRLPSGGVALVPASRFIPENGPDSKKHSLGRANAAKFMERLCQYPGNPKVIAEAQQHILEAHAERLTQETGKPVTGPGRLGQAFQGLADQAKRSRCISTPHSQA